MGGDGLGVLDTAAVEQVGGDARGPEGVAVGGDAEFGLAHPPLDHAEDIHAAHAVLAEVSVPPHRAPQRGSLLISNPSHLEVGIEIGLGVVVGGDLVELAPLFVETQPPALALPVVVLDVHADHGAGAGKGLALGAMAIAAGAIAEAAVAAVVALFDLAAEGSGAAAFDRRHGAALGGGQRGGETAAESVPVTVEDVSHLKIGAGHRVDSADCGRGSGLVVVETLKAARCR